jgi:hypothetical protein
MYAKWKREDPEREYLWRLNGSPLPPICPYCNVVVEPTDNKCWHRDYRLLNWRRSDKDSWLEWRDNLDLIMEAELEPKPKLRRTFAEYERKRAAVATTPTVVAASAFAPPPPPKRKEPAIEYRPDRFKPKIYSKRMTEDEDTERRDVKFATPPPPPVTVHYSLKRKRIYRSEY